MQSIEQQKQYYDEYWQDVEFPVYPLRLERAIFILDSINRIGARKPRIIDLGCGTGWLASMLGHIGPTLGVELSPLAVAEATRKYPHVQFLQADIMNWDVPQGEFDLVISQEVLEHFENQSQYLDICRRVLRPGGHLILTTPNACTFNAMPEEQRGAWGIQPIENWLTAGQLRDLLSPGFRVTRLTTVIPKYGQKGIYRIWSSGSLRRTLKAVRLLGSFEHARLCLGYGLHLAAVAQRKD